MTTLVEAMLETARLVAPVVDGTATGGSTTTLVDTNRVEAPETFTGGILFMTSGDLSGNCYPITGFGENTITIPTVGVPVSAGDTYTAVPSGWFDKETLKQAIFYGLRQYGNIMLVDESLTVVTDQSEYDLPANVSNVRRVEIAE